MPPAHAFLVNLALALCAAATATVIFQRLGQPVVLGYLLAGLVIGPHVPVPLVADHAVIEAMADLGVVLLMFAIGLEFRLAKLAAVAPTGGIVALVEVSLMGSAGWLGAAALGWTATERLFAGAIVAISSTSILAKAFDEQRVTGRRRDVVFGILVAEDLLAILLMVALSVVATGATPSARDLGIAALRLGVVLALAIAGGMLVVPRLFRSIVALGQPETITVASVGLCFALALGAEHLGYTSALGAFIAGMLVAESGHGEEVEHLVRPVRDVFAALFFVSVGMLIEPELVVENLGAVLALTALVLLGKVVAVSTGSFLVGNGLRTSVQAGMSLAQIGEFSFILAGLGAAGGATRGFLYPVAIAVSAITTFTTPLFVRGADRVADGIEARLPAPLRTLAASYSAWIDELRSAPETADRRTRARRQIQLLLGDAAALVAVAVSHHLLGPEAAHHLEPLVGGLAGWIVTGVALAVAAPLVVGLVRISGTLGRTLAGEAGAAVGDRALVTLLQLAVLLAVGLPTVALTQPFLPPLRGPAALAVVVVGLALLAWRRAERVEPEVRSGVAVLVDAVRPSAAPEPDPAAVTGSDETGPGTPG